MTLTPLIHGTINGSRGDTQLKSEMWRIQLQDGKKLSRVNVNALRFSRRPLFNRMPDLTSNFQIPSEKDWGDYKSDLDQEYGHRVFYGKNLKETISFFERNVIERAGELQFMPLVPFRYYMLAFRNYVMSKQVLANEMASDAASCFLNLIIEKLQKDPKAIEPILEDLMPAVEYVATNQELFDADIDIYGNFAERLTEIKGKIEK
jgi:hypothetical protein